MNKQLCALLLAVVALLFPSCVAVYPYPYSGGYSSYGPSYYDSGYSGYGHGYGSSYYGRPAYYGSSYSVCSVCRSSPCRCSRSHLSHSHSNSPSRTSRSEHLNDHGKIKLIGGSDGNHSNRPDGWHSKEWYQKRGYDLKDYKIKDEEGHVVKSKKK